MTPAAIVALVRDAVILIALAALIYLLITYGRDAVKVADMKAVQKQLTVNAETQAQWAEEARSADAKRTQDMERVNAAIDLEHTPVYVVRGGSPSGCPVPAAAAQAGSRAPGAGGAEPGAGKDIRPDLNAYKKRVEKVVSDCRNALDKWP